MSASKHRVSWSVLHLPRGRKPSLAFPPHPLCGQPRVNVPCVRRRYAELDKETKNRISHRGAAIRLLKAFLEERGDEVLGSTSSE